MTFRAIVAAIAGFAALFAAALAAEDSILILDSSGSMWGQIEGEAKMAIAKRVVNDVIDSLPAARRIGLMAYGHRRAGDCADIEMVAPVGADRAAVKAAVARLTPRGKTPMAASVKRAAELLQYTERKATVILVSDGIETCEPDPCGVAAALEKAGVDLTVHVVGFDLHEEHEQAQLRCLAENTGGAFFAAGNAAELAAALQSTVVETRQSAVKDGNLYLRATELDGGPLIETGLSWRVRPSSGGDPVLAKENTGAVNETVAPGTYDVAVERKADGLKGEAKGVAVSADAVKIVTIALNFPVEASVRAEPAGAVMAGTNVKVHWTGPARQGDFISFAQKGAGLAEYETYGYVARGNPVEVRAPLEPGAYEIRYVLGRPIRTLASVETTVVPATATLDAPASAVAGAEIAVAFTGPPAGSGDYVTVTKPGAPDTAYMSYAYAAQGSPAKLRMPLEAGEYELRFVQGNRKVLARRAIAVTGAEATLSAPETAKTGESVKVAFTGPAAGSGDYITVTEPDAEPSKYNDYYYASRGSPATVRMPLEAGEYEIRFVQGNSKVIARQTITVEAASATLNAKASAVAGETVSIGYTGPPANSGDFVTVAAPGDPDTKYNDYWYTSRGAPAKVRMPLEAGSYEIRFVQGNRKVIARRPVNVTAATATLVAPAQAAAKTVIDVAFTGPPHGAGDYVTVAAPGAGATQYAHYANTGSGSPAKLRMPDAPGTYEIRFVHGNKYVLARRTIQVTAP